jgi:hypothetical protein
MTYDIDFRFRLALSPEALTTVQTTMHALGNAIGDARNAGCDPEADPAVRLLSRHLGRVAHGLSTEARHPEDSDLRRACLDRIGALVREPALVVLARRGIGNDEVACRVFRREAGVLLRALAAEFGSSAVAKLEKGPTCLGHAVLTLVTPLLFVRVTTDLPRPGCEIEYRRNDFACAHSRTADIAELLDPPKLARRIARELDIAIDRQPAFV